MVSPEISESAVEIAVVIEAVAGALLSKVAVVVVAAAFFVGVRD